RRVPVVCHGDADRVSRGDRRDNLGIVSAVLAWWFRRPAGGCTAGRLDRRVCETVRKRLPGRSGGRPTEGGRTHLPGGTVSWLDLPVSWLDLPVNWRALRGDRRLLGRR